MTYVRQTSRDRHRKHVAQCGRNLRTARAAECAREVDEGRVVEFEQRRRDLRQRAEGKSYATLWNSPVSKIFRNKLSNTDLCSFGPPVLKIQNLWLEHETKGIKLENKVTRELQLI